MRDEFGPADFTFFLFSGAALYLRFVSPFVLADMDRVCTVPFINTQTKAGHKLHRGHSARFYVLLLLLILDCLV